MKFAGCHGNVKNDEHTIDVSKSWQRIKEKLLKVLAPKSKSSVENFEKTYDGEK